MVINMSVKYSHWKCGSCGAESYRYVNFGYPDKGFAYRWICEECEQINTLQVPATLKMAKGSDAYEEFDDDFDDEFDHDPEELDKLIRAIKQQDKLAAVLKDCVLRSTGNEERTHYILQYIRTKQVWLRTLEVIMGYTDEYNIDYSFLDSMLF